MFSAWVRGENVNGGGLTINYEWQAQAAAAATTILLLTPQAVTTHRQNGKLNIAARVIASRIFSQCRGFRVICLVVGGDDDVFFTGFPPKTKNECHLIPNGFYSKRIPMCVCDVQIMWLVVEPHTHASDKLMTRPSSSFGCEIIHQNTMKPITSERIKKLSIEHLPPHFFLSKFTLLHQMVGSCSL